MKAMKNIFLAAACLATLGTISSCDDMLDMGNDHVIYTDGRELDKMSDQGTSLLGIVQQLQGIAVRTNLLGEVRADLVTVGDNAPNDLKALANLDLQDDNAYNSIKDYYAVINNCNLYLAQVDSTAGNVNRNELYFKEEIAQVHSIRAWVYLQLALVYGKVPLVTEPVISKVASDAEYPMYDLQAICDYFIADLQPYYGIENPTFNSGVGDVAALANTSMIPSQLIMGDLNLWKASLNHDAEAAKQAAKNYYDYIVWTGRGANNPLYTGAQRNTWSARNLYNGQLTMPSTTLGYRSVTTIPMDSASNSGNYNQLLKLYSYSNTPTFQAASIAPSDQLRELSNSQEYVGYDTEENLVTVTSDRLSEIATRNGYTGDLRYGATYSRTSYSVGNEDYDMQVIYKHADNDMISFGKDVTIYHAYQIYLRLAEALNYAGYPRFARAILTTGLSDVEIEAQVKPYYGSDSDLEFINYFKFNDNQFRTVSERYTAISQNNAVRYYARTRRQTGYNMIGIHMRGSGDAYANENYVPLNTPDSTSYPFEAADTIPAIPTTPDQSKKPSASEPVTYELWRLIQEAAGTAASNINERNYERYVQRFNDSIVVWENLQIEYAQQVENRQKAIEAFQQAWDEWRISAYGDAALIADEQTRVDQAILDEQALELAYEGHRFYDLMRRALWWSDNTRLSTPISKRLPSATKLNDSNNWYLPIK